MKDPKPDVGMEGFSLWTAYGGWRALLTSRYLWVSVVVTIVLSPAWMRPLWWETAISVISSMMGFTLAGFAILVGFGDDTFKSLIATPVKGKTPVLLRTAAAFAYFIFTQVAALTISLIIKFSYGYKTDWYLAASRQLRVNPDQVGDVLQKILWGVGFFLFAYTAACTVAATKWIYELCRAYVVIANQQRKNGDKGNQDPKS